ncbi:MAG: hypothetical protein JW751_07505 [Polyangiaceae bacterium]|nr:hypothetical protein [Polyangiaceae bacterium]
MKKAHAILGFVALITGVSACSLHARDGATYASDTAVVLATRNDPIKACYDEVLKTDQTAGGTVEVKFTVEKKTGSFVDPKLGEKTTAPPPLADCVLKQFGGLVLTPPDRRVGDATFVWEFAANEPIQLPTPE